MKVHHEGHSAAVCIPKEPGEMLGRETRMGRAVRVQGLLRKERRATKRWWLLPPIAPFLPSAHPPWAGVDLPRT
jgi:hypothetical protein